MRAKIFGKNIYNSLLTYKSTRVGPKKIRRFSGARPISARTRIFAVPIAVCTRLKVMTLSDRYRFALSRFTVYPIHVLSRHVLWSERYDHRRRRRRCSNPEITIAEVFVVYLSILYSRKQNPTCIYVCVCVCDSISEHENSFTAKIEKYSVL